MILRRRARSGRWSPRRIGGRQAGCGCGRDDSAALAGKQWLLPSLQLTDCSLLSLQLTELALRSGCGDRQSFWLRWSGFPGRCSVRGRSHSGRGEIERGVPDDLPEVAVGILEVSRVDAPGPVVRWVGDGCSGRLGLRDDLVDLGPAGHHMPDAELAGLRRGQGDQGVFGQLGARIYRQHEPAVEVEHRRGPVGNSLVACELGTDQPFSLEAQPVAVERQGAVEVSYREGDDMDARLHGRFLIVWPVLLQSMIGARGYRGLE